MILQRLHGRHRRRIREHEQRAEILRPLQQPSGAFIGIRHLEAAAGLLDQVLIRLDAVCPHRVHKAAVPQLADGAVIPARDHGGDAPVSPPDQLFRRPIGRGIVVDGDGGIVLLVQTSEVVGITAADKGNPDHRELRGSIVKAPAQEEQPLQLLFPLKDGPGLDLIPIRADIVQHHGKAAALDLVRDGLQNGREKQISVPSHHHADGVGPGFHQIPRADVRDVGAALHLVQHALAHFLTHVRVMIQHTGNRAYTHTAVFRNVLDRHIPHPIILKPTLKSF